MFGVLSVSDTVQFFVVVMRDTRTLSSGWTTAELEMVPQSVLGVDMEAFTRAAYSSCVALNEMPCLGLGEGAGGRPGPIQHVSFL